MSGQRMMIGRDRFREEGEVGGTVPDFQIAQDLVIAAVFLDDVDHMLDAVPDKGHERRVRLVPAGRWEVVVHRHLPGELGKARG